ncbi:hypothetical protein UFOVP221_76 [uncultured Caudovirales phage]|uniref:Uncharacterized protein n=1 Tax=uncultured Caudovirales phage TaxID=2100421 RepID=A0A6J7WWF6_9CAUD|nr:hypothetical protein UFOVP221_76 [uncultured Caudovirales phage]
MTIFQKKTDGSQPQTKLQKRVASISTPELVSWAENALYVIGKNVTGYLRMHDGVMLEEADLGAEALYAITQELKKRASNGV